jgi:nucleotide-binding universal stress UspA family protein
MKKILVPYDFSDIATHALNFAADLARKNHSCDVSLIHVIEHPTPDTIKTMGVSDYDPMEAIFVKKMIESAEGKMQNLMSDQAYNDIKLSFKIVLGHPFKEITEEITTSEIELVVMGTSGASGAQEFLVGSNAERMVRHSKCPVITLRKATKVDEIKTIALASNFRDVTDEFVDHVKRLQRAFGAELKLVKINTPLAFTTTKEDKKQMEKFIKHYELENCTMDIYNHHNEEDGIIDYSEDIQAGLVAIGTRQKKGLGHFLSGSIAEDVVNHSKVPVWTYGLDNV